MSERSRAVEMLSQASVARANRRWTGNDASARQHHGVVALTSSPLVLSLSWRSEAGAPAKFVGCYRLDLERLLKEELIRVERAGEVRVRFYHDYDGKVYLQRRLGTPRFLLGRV